MENSSYALYIATGVLIGIVILSFVVFRWRQIGNAENAQDEAAFIKNRADFNQEYEAYNKKLMYGTDVLSCLNKAQNNNQKYVYNNYYGADGQNIGKDDRAEYFIDVEVKLNSTLYDDVKAYYKNSSGNNKRITGVSSVTNFDDKIFKRTDFNNPIIYYYYFKNGRVYKESKKYTDIMFNNLNKDITLYNILTTNGGKIETKITAGTYNLLTSSDDSNKGTTTEEGKVETAKLSALISTVGLGSQIIENKPAPTVYNSSDWVYCVWTTAASDFKTRKFRCTGTEYNTDTGYIEKISFEEI